jgi:hypothetical protein
LKWYDLPVNVRQRGNAKGSGTRPNAADDSTSILVQWLKDLWKEVWARSLFLIGLVSNVVTFFLPPLQLPVLRGTAYSLLAVGFLWANFSVYKRLRAEITKAQKQINDATEEGRERAFTMSVKAEGNPPSQVLKVIASQSVTVSRLAYMLSDETCIVDENVSCAGETFEVPLDQKSLTTLFNTPRLDRSTWDHSGPVKIGLTVSTGRTTQRYVLPMRIENTQQGNRVIGSRDFHGTD